jgi:sRNA-binding carbon storage regulator CsrA
MSKSDASTLVLTLHEGEEVRVGETLLVAFRAERRGKIQLSITAPRELEIARVPRQRD